MSGVLELLRSLSVVKGGHVMTIEGIRQLIATSGDRTVAELQYLAAARSKSLPDYASDKWARNEGRGKR